MEFGRTRVMQMKLARNLIFAIILVGAGGCNHSIEQLEAAQATANAALAEAKDATAKANSAHGIASEAAYEAAQAEKRASSALECCNDNAGRLDRMFEKAMMK